MEEDACELLLVESGLDNVKFKPLTALIYP